MPKVINTVAIRDATPRCAGANIMTHNYVKNPYVFDYHDENGPFLIPDDFRNEPMKNCGYRHARDQIVELRESQDVLYFFPLSDELALGEEVPWKMYDSDLFQPNWTQPTREGPLALWNLHTGDRLTTLQGYHLGQLRGARLLNDSRLVTWARDFLLRVWDLNTGTQQDVIPLPAAVDETGTPIVTSRTCSEWSDKELKSYLALDSQYPSFAVTLMIKAKQSARIESFDLTTKTATGVTYRSVDRDQGIHRIPTPFRELEDAEAGYSDSVVLVDGRLLIGGITHGALEHTYVWDGGLALIILYTSLNYFDNFKIDGELEPGVVQLSDATQSVTFNIPSVEEHER
ncbi:MAG: hypothetical protein HKN32_09825 [Flavobacteriales bacterium]|nr:hypothetical protein [Flavobacteriales bacterium]